MGGITGKLADLVILNADPAGNIQNLQFIDAVIVNGKLFDRSALDSELVKVVNQVNRNR
jgi:hypothetical protein